MRSGRHNADIIGGNWRVIFNDNGQLSVSSVAISIDNSNKEIAVFSFTKEVISQRIAKTDFASIQIDTGNRQCTKNCDEFLPN